MSNWLFSFFKLVSLYYVSCCDSTPQQGRLTISIQTIYVTARSKGCPGVSKLVDNISKIGCISKYDEKFI